ncbi:MAG: Octaprenyl-diphosphate synthase [uncultured Campylobacterales bacterium]|uniref:Octaprenyl-diphosphate synthase n=1 Tax=uncultured Campylobacterales bacterium TaxID=352960 RepID=A0A6S6S314_9BACT|nr:MAG: Octaprenyl-diphosphate synthase [uncultured Campylobacterales bacterium]
MNSFDTVLEQFINDLNNNFVADIYANIPSGKRLRPKLIFNIIKNEQSIKLAAIIELIHISSLLHDDVIDDALTRRNENSINNTYGNKTAIMLGDILYSKAFYELTAFDTKIAKIVSKAVSTLSIGELEDVKLAEFFNTDKELYLSMIYKKTASLIEASTHAGAILAGHDENIYKTYGKNLGVAFQIIDDILDITENSQTLGKPALNDFKEGKVTLPYLIAYEKSSFNTQEKLKSMYKRVLNKEESTWVKELLNNTNAIKDSYNYAKTLANQALTGIKEPKLQEIISSILDRDF